MAKCPACEVSLCLDCEEPVHEFVYRCDPCLVEWMANDPGHQEIIDAQNENAVLRTALRDLATAFHGAWIDAGYSAESLGDEYDQAIAALKLSKGGQP